MDASTNTAAANTAAKLTEYDFVVLVDKSGSMAEPNKGSSGRTRWEAVQESALQFARDVGQFDSDGIDVVVFGGSTVESHTGVTADKVKEVFGKYSPRGGTPLAEALTAGLKLAGKSDKKDFIVVFTDGVPDNKAAVVDVIKAAANSQETDDALTILFVQVGDDGAASAFLKTLDDDLTGVKFDIVDAKTIDQVDNFASTTELILAAIND